LPPGDTDCCEVASSAPIAALHMADSVTAVDTPLLKRKIAELTNEK
jgi:hypothetical protein